MIINLRIFFKTKTATTTTAAKVTTTANCTTKTSPSKTSTNITQQVQAQQSQAQSQAIQRSSGTASGTVTIATTPAQPTKNAIVVANTGQIVQSAQVCINPYFHKILSKHSDNINKIRLINYVGNINWWSSY